MKNPTPLRQMIIAAMFVAIGFYLPMLTGQIPEVGNFLLPMHLPVLLCGYVCGGPWGLAVGAVLPLMRHLLMGMPPLYTAIAMTFELAVYGLMTGLLYRALPKRPAFVYLNLAISMLAGRVVWGAAKYVLLGLGKTEFSMAVFWAEGFVKAVPGIILQVILIPAVIIALQRAGLMVADPRPQAKVNG